MRNLAITIWLYLAAMVVMFACGVFCGALSGAAFAAGDRREGFRWLIRMVVAVVVGGFVFYKLSR